MKKFLKTALLLAFLSLAVSCNFNTPKPPVSYVKDNGTWKGVFEGYWAGMNNNYLFWNLDSPSDEWDTVYDRYVEKFEALGSVDYSDTANTREAILLLFDVAKGLSDGHYDLTVPIDKEKNASFCPRDYQIAWEKYKDIAGATERGLLELFYDRQNRRSEYNELFPDDYRYESTKTILANTFKVKWPDDPADGNFAFISDYDLYDRLPGSIDQSKLTYKLVLPTGSEYLLDEYFSEWMLFGTYKDGSVDFSCLLGLTKRDDAKGIPDNSVYLGFSSFNFYTYVNEGNSDLLALLEIFKGYKRRNDTTGLVLDVRGNTGGFNIDRDLLFSDLVAELHQFASTRQKIGDNRLDYSPWMPLYLYPYTPKANEAGYSPSPLYDKPIVAVTNRFSISNGELTAMLAKSFPKGTTVGGLTYGGQGALSGDKTNTTANGGEFSVGSYISTVYTPYLQTKALDGTIYEGKGIPPEIPVDFNKTEFESGTDARLERAFQYVIDTQ